MQNFNLSNDTANSLLLQAYKRKIVGLRLLPQVIEEWRRAQREEYQPRTAYSLFNCFTDVLGHKRQSRFPAESALTTMRLSKLLSPQANNNNREGSDAAIAA